MSIVKQLIKEHRKLNSDSVEARAREAFSRLLSNTFGLALAAHVNKIRTSALLFSGDPSLEPLNRARLLLAGDDELTIVFLAAGNPIDWNLAEEGRASANLIDATLYGKYGYYPYSVEDLAPMDLDREGVAMGVLCRSVHEDSKATYHREIIRFDSAYELGRLASSGLVEFLSEAAFNEDDSPVRLTSSVELFLRLARYAPGQELSQRWLKRDV